MSETLRVLIVDDDADICELVRQRLLLDGEGAFEPVLVSSEFERLGAPGTFRSFDCLVLDLWLTPNGILEEFPMAHLIYRWARADNPHMPIVVFSAVLGIQHNQAIESQAELTLAKPSIDQISNAIKTVCHRRRSDDWPV